MFFVVVREKEVDVHPRFFGPQLSSYLHEKLRGEVEGSCDVDYGYVVLLVDILASGKGLLKDYGGGFATFLVKYRCLVFRPFRHEVLDTVVTSVNKMGFFCSAGLLKLFVSSHLIPDEFKYRSLELEEFVSEDEGVRIFAGKEVRVRIVGIRKDSVSDLFCVATIAEDYLGVISAATL